MGLLRFCLDFVEYESRQDVTIILCSIIAAYPGNYLDVSNGI